MSHAKQKWATVCNTVGQTDTKIQNAIKEKDPNNMAEEFMNYFEHYLGVHEPQEKPQNGLAQLIEQAKNELE